MGGTGQGTLMRHFFSLTLAIPALARRMGEATFRAGLITTTGLTHGAATGLCATGGTISVAAVAMTADHDLNLAAGTVVETGRRWQRRFPCRRDVDEILAKWDTSQGRITGRGGGCGTGGRPSHLDRCRTSFYDAVDSTDSG